MALQNKVFVGSLPNGTKPEALRHLFEKQGEVVQCDVVNRCGFVYMQTAELVEKCVNALNGTEFNGQKIVVEVGRPDKKSTGAPGIAKLKRTRRGNGKNVIRVPPSGPAGVNKRIPRGRGGGQNQGMFPSDISPDVKEAVTMRLAGAIMELLKDNPNALYDNMGDMQGMPHPRQQHPQGVNYGSGGPNERPRSNAPRQTGGPPPSGNRNERPPKKPRNDELFTRRPINDNAKQAGGLIKGKVTAGPPVVIAPKPDIRRRGKGPIAASPGGRPGPRPNGLPRGNDGFGHNNAPNMNFSNGPNRSGGPGRHSGGGAIGGSNRGDGGNSGSNNNQFYSWRNENMNGRSNAISSGGTGGGGGGVMNRGFNDNYGGNSNSMFNQGGGVGGGNGGMGQDRRGFALPGYQQQQQHHQPSAFLQSNFDGCLPNPGGFTTGVSNVVSSGSGSGGGGGGGGSGFSYSSSGQNMGLDNRSSGGYRSSSGFLGNRGMGNTDNGDSGFGGYDNNGMSRGNFNSNNNNTQMYQDDFPPLNSNRSSGNMLSSGGFNQSGGMNSNNMNRNIDPWQSMDNRRFN